MQITIRRATSGDAAATAELFLRARRAGSAQGSIPPLVHDDDDVRDWIAHALVPRLECWVAVQESGAIVGMLVLNADWVDHLYVDPDVTGAGVGSDLIAKAKRERPGGLRLWTFVSNEGAQRFYLRHGFAEVERADGSSNEEGAPSILYAWSPPRSSGESAIILSTASRCC